MKKSNFDCIAIFLMVVMKLNWITMNYIYEFGCDLWWIKVLYLCWLLVFGVCRFCQSNLIVFLEVFHQSIWDSYCRFAKSCTEWKNRNIDASVPPEPVTPQQRNQDHAQNQNHRISINEIRSGDQRSFLSVNLFYILWDLKDFSFEKSSEVAVSS